MQTNSNIEETISQDQAQTALRWARLAIRPSFIATYFNVGLPTLVQACGPEFRKPVTEPQRAVLRAIYESATARHNTAAANFWLKIHCPHLLPKPASKTKTPEPPKQNYERKDPSLAFEFDVYCNDGEPNYPY